MLVFRPDDPAKLSQILPQMKQNVNVDRIKGFRHPSPGSQQGTRIPLRENSDNIYDIQEYTRDPRNLPPDEETLLNSGKNPTLIAPKRFEQGSPGNKNPAVLRYDPSGLRSTMSATWPELNKAVDANAKPNHLPVPEWFNDIDAIEKECERKGIPYVAGRRFKYASQTSNFNEVRW
jgi:hypothetical protein